MTTSLYPSVPAPTTWTDGPMLTSELRGDLTNGVSFLADRPMFSAYSTSTPAISGTATPVTLDTENFDTWGGHQPLGTHPENYYCQAPGWYAVEGFVPWQYTSAGDFLGAQLAHTTGGTYSQTLGHLRYEASGQNPGMAVTDLIRMTAAGPAGSASTDYVQLQAYAASGTVSLQGSSPNVPSLSARWVSSGTASSLAVPANGSFPVPPAYADTTWLNANVRDAIAYLTDPPVLRYAAPGTQTLASMSWASGGTITLSRLTVDNYSAWSGSSTWTAPAAGIHWISGQVAVSSNASHAGAYATGISVNGTVTWGGAVYGPAVAGTVVTGMTDRFRLQAGDTVQLVGFQGTTGNVTVESPTRLVIAWENK